MHVVESPMLHSKCSAAYLSFAHTADGSDERKWTWYSSPSEIRIIQKLDLSGSNTFQDSNFGGFLCFYMEKWIHIRCTDWGTTVHKIYT